MKFRFPSKFILPILLLLFLGIIRVSFVHSGYESSTDKLPEQRYLPKASYVNRMSLGHNESVASVLWVNALVEYGGSLFDKSEFIWFSSYGNLVTTLDSLMYMPYYFISATAHAPDTSTIQLMQRAHRMFPENWRLSLYSAVYLAKQMNDFEEASRFMKPYENVDSVPAYIRRTSKTFLLKAMPTSEALLQLLEDYFQPQNAPFQKGLESQIRDVLNAKTSPDSLRVAQILLATKQGHLPPENAFQELLRIQSQK